MRRSTDIGHVGPSLMCDQRLSHSAFGRVQHLSIGQIVAALGDGVIPAPELRNLNHLIGRLEDLLGSRPQPPSGRGGSSPIPGLEDVSSSSESSFWSCYSPPSDILKDSIAFSLEKVSSLLSEGHSAQSSSVVEDEIEVGDAGGV